MKILYDDGRIKFCFLNTDKFKTEAVSISFCTPLNKENAYANALIPMVLNRGCDEYPTTSDITRRLMSLYGGSFGAEISSVGEIQLLKFNASYAAPRFSKNCPDIAKQMSDFIISVLTKPLTENGNAFRTDYFNQERSNADEMIRSEINDKQSFALRRCIEIMCSDEPYGVSEYGALGDGERYTPQSLYTHYTDTFMRNMPIRIFYCGRERPDALLDAVLNSSLNINTAVGHKSPNSQDAQNVQNTQMSQMSLELPIGYKELLNPERKDVTERFEVTQGKLELGFRTNTPPDSPDVPAQTVMNGIFGGGPQSKLFQNVREKESLCYYASSRVERLKGLMMAYSGIDIANRERAQDLIIAQLEDIRKGRVSDEEMQSTKASIVNSLRSGQDTQFGLMDYYMVQSFLGETTEIDDYIKSIEAVTIDDVVRVANRVALDTVYFLTSKEE